ncbi:hypothetical protein L1887_38074 [Cichorium endivia]|nr:hypothetical protein L1887_38074 [Cichorium endivia]
MDSIFNLKENERSDRLRQIIESFGFTYVCLWSRFSNPSNCLIFMDGVYKEEHNQSSSSSGSLAMRCFVDYQKSIFLLDDYSGGVPGFAFMRNLPYMERKGLELLGMASNSAQLQFYEEARIKTAIFMGCKNGEIELGLSNGSSQNNYEIVLKKMFPGDFPQDSIPQQLDQGRASSSSSSLRSLSMDNSVEYSPFLFNMLQTTSYMPEIYPLEEAFLDRKAPHKTPPSSTMRSEDPLQRPQNQIRTSHSIPSREHEECLMTRAIIAALSSSSSPSSSPCHHPQAPPFASAFKRYRSYLGPIKQRVQSRQNLNRRSLSFFRNLSQARAQQGQMIQTTRPTSNQLHHMIAERKRREKINESLEALKSLLPPGSKKDKASVLSKTKEYINSLKSQVKELDKKNRILEAEHSAKEALDQDSGNFSGERLAIRITDIGESTSESRVVDLELNVRGESILVDLVVRVLEFMKQIENVSVMSVDAGTRRLETQALTNRVVLRLRIQGSEWDDSRFQEAVRRAFDDLAQ